MAIENFDEVKSYFEANKDNEDIKNYVNGFVNADRVNNYLNTDDGKKMLQPMLDKYHDKGMETWKKNNLSKLVDDEVKKRFPDADPKDKEIAELKAQFQQMQAESKKKDLKNMALKTATDKKLPVELIDYFVGDDEDSTNANLSKFMDAINAHDEAIKKEFASTNGSYTPPTGKATNVSDTEAQLNKIFGIKSK